MEQFAISNFKYGLDARRSELTSQPGTAMVLENGHVNSGGEIEKRKAFVSDPTRFDITKTFGLEATDAGLVTFGSFPGSAIVPAGVTYQRLVTSKPPFVSHMVRCLASCNFNGKAFVIALFSDGGTFLFYDGVLVGQSQDGIVLPNFTSVASQGYLLTNAINLIEGWKAVDNANGSVTVTSPPGVYYTPVPEKDTVSGLLGFNLVDKDYAGSAGTPAWVSLAVTVNGTPGVTSYEVTAPLNQDGTGIVSLCSVLAGASANATAIAISDGINAATYLTGYTSSHIGNSFIVFAPLAWGAAANGYLVTLTTNGGTVGPGGGGSTGTIKCNIDTPTNETIVFSRSSALVFSKVVHASGAGGTPPYISYHWAEKSNGSGDEITIGSPDASSTNFTKHLALNTSAYGIFNCTVTDSFAGVAISVDVTVLLENTSNA